MLFCGVPCSSDCLPCSLQADLLGTVKENKFDELARIDLHQAWEQQADAAMLRQLVHGVQHGFKRNRNQGDDDDDEVCTMACG